MQQRTIDQQILDSKNRQRLSAGFWLIKHLDHMTIYEQSLLTFVWLHVGTKHSEWTLSDTEVMSYMKCGRTKFYDCLQSCQTRSLLIVQSIGNGLRRYRLVESNLAETMPVEAQRKYFELLGRSPREIELLIESAVRNANPPHGRPVRHTDAPNKEEGQSKAQPEVQETSPPPSSKLRTASDPPDGSPIDWAVAAKSLVDVGILQTDAALTAAKANGATAAQVVEVVSIWKTRAGQNGRGALVNRIKRLVPGDDLTRRWPAPLRQSTEAKPANARQLILAGRREGLDDETITKQLAAAGLEWDG